MTDLISEANSIGFGRNGHLGFVIFENLPNLSNEYKKHLAHHISSMFPNNNEVNNFSPFKQHLHTSFMRKLFGMTERNGTLLDITHPSRITQYKQNCDQATKWDNSFNFVHMLETEFIDQNKQMGIILLHEALGHRYGDLYTISSGDDKIKYQTMMIEHYRKSFCAAKNIKCAKQMYVLWYWEGCYYFKNGNNDVAKKYIMKFHKSYIKYKRYARVEPSDKLKISFKILKKICLPQEYFDYLQVIRHKIKK